MPPTGDVIHTGAPRDEMVLPMVGWVLVLFGWGLVELIIGGFRCKNQNC